MIDTNTKIVAIDERNQQAWDIVRVQPSDAIEIANGTLQESVEKEYSLGEAWAKTILGAGHTWLGNFDEALTFNLEAIDLLEKCGEVNGSIQAHYNLSVLYYFIGDHDKQRELCEHSLSLAEQVDDENGKANALNGIGTSYYSQRQTKEALEFLNKGLPIAEKGNDKQAIARILDGIGQCHFIDKNFTEALEFKNKVIALYQEESSSQVLSFAHEGLGEIYSELGETEKALEHFRTSLKLRDDSGFKLGLGQTTVKIAELYLKTDQLDEALRYFKSAVVLAEDLEADELAARAHLGLSQVYEKQENSALFMRHYKAHHEAQQVFNEKLEGKKLRAAALMSDFEKVQLEKEELEKKNEELQQYFEDVRTLSSIGNEITSTTNLENIFNIIYERINSLMDAQGIFIGICNYEAQKLEVHLALDNGVRDGYFEYSLKDDDKKLPAWAVTHAKSVHINDYDNEVTDYLPNGEEVIHNTPNSVVIIPLLVKEEVIGILFSQSDQKNAFSPHHYNILKSFANYLAIAIDNAALYKSMDEKIQERTEALEQTHKDSVTLNKIGQELISSLDFNDVFDRLYGYVNELMDATIFGVRLYHKEEQVVEYKYGYEKGELLTTLSIPMSNKSNLSVWCVENDKEVVLGDMSTEASKYVKNAEIVEGEMPLSVIMYPLRKGEEVIGLISVQSFQKNIYTDYHLTIVKTLAHYTTISLENARSYEIMEERVKERTSFVSKAKGASK